jgi:hypothetical protein
MRIAERMFLKMKEDEAKNKIEEEEKTKRRIHLFTNHKVRLSNPLLIYALSLMGVTVKAKELKNKRKCFISKKISSSKKSKTWRS